MATQNKEEEKLRTYSDRQLMEKMTYLQYKSEKHLQYLSNVVTVFVVLTLIAFTISLFSR